MLSCPQGHALDEANTYHRKPPRSGWMCRTCRREGMLRAARERGVQPRQLQRRCKRGHDLAENRRANGKGCAICHRQGQLERYWDNPERYRLESSERQHKNRESATRRQREWRQANIEHVREVSRDRQRARALGYDLEAVSYAEILRLDPCSYCGGAAGGTLDHIQPVANGGANNWTNLTGACPSCNSQKRTRPLLRFLLARRSMGERP